MVLKDENVPVDWPDRRRTILLHGRDLWRYTSIVMQSTCYVHVSGGSTWNVSDSVNYEEQTYRSGVVAFVREWSAPDSKRYFLRRTRQFRSRSSCSLGKHYRQKERSRVRQKRKWYWYERDFSSVLGILSSHARLHWYFCIFLK